MSEEIEGSFRRLPPREKKGRLIWSTAVLITGCNERGVKIILGRVY